MNFLKFLRMKFGQEGSRAVPVHGSAKPSVSHAAANTGTTRDCNDQDTRMRQLILQLADPERQVRKAAQVSLDELDPSWPTSAAAKATVSSLHELLKSSDHKIRGAARVTIEKIETDPAEVLEKARMLVESGKLEGALSCARRAADSGGADSGARKLLLQLELRVNERMASLERRMGRALNGPFSGIARELVADLADTMRALQSDLNRRLVDESEDRYALLDSHLAELESLQDRWRQHEDSRLAHSEAFELKARWKQ